MRYARVCTTATWSLDLETRGLFQLAFASQSGSDHNDDDVLEHAETRVASRRADARGGRKTGKPLEK